MNIGPLLPIPPASSSGRACPSSIVCTPSRACPARSGHPIGWTEAGKGRNWQDGGLGASWWFVCRDPWMGGHEERASQSRDRGRWVGATDIACAECVREPLSVSLSLCLCPSLPLSFSRGPRAGGLLGPWWKGIWLFPGMRLKWESESILILMHRLLAVKSHSGQSERPLGASRLASA